MKRLQLAQWPVHWGAVITTAVPEDHPVWQILLLAMTLLTPGAKASALPEAHTW